MSKRNRKKKKSQLHNFKIVREVDVMLVNQSFEGCRVADAVEPNFQQRFDDPYGFDDSYGFDHPFPLSRHKEYLQITRYV